MSDTALCKAVIEMQRGLVDADLRGRILKKRVALPGQGKRVVYGFKKNEKSDISDRELEAFRMFAEDLLSRTAAQLGTLVASGELEEICNGDEA